MENNVNYSLAPRAFHGFVSETFTYLVKSKKEDDVTTFNQLLLKTLPEIKKYIARRLKRAEVTGKITPNTHQVNDIIDQLFIEVYDNIEEVKHENDFYLWLFKKTDALLQDVLVDEEFDQLFFENIENFSTPQWKDLEEKYTVDGGADFVLEEELDNTTYTTNEYQLKDVFIEDKEKELIDKLDKELSKEKIHRYIDMVLYNLPPLMTSVFELNTKYDFEFAEIAKIKNISTEKVNDLINKAREKIKFNFSRMLS